MGGREQVGRNEPPSRLTTPRRHLFRQLHGITMLHTHTRTRARTSMECHSMVFLHASRKSHTS